MSRNPFQCECANFDLVGPDFYCLATADTKKDAVRPEMLFVYGSSFQRACAPNFCECAGSNSPAYKFLFSLEGVKWRLSW